MKSNSKKEIARKAKQVKGAVKEAAGKIVTGSSLENDGKIEKKDSLGQAKAGRVHKATGK